AGNHRVAAGSPRVVVAGNHRVAAAGIRLAAAGNHRAVVVAGNHRVAAGAGAGNSQEVVAVARSCAPSR
ncbi:MAG: hypothetical protein WBN99_18055, partial [Mycobacterium sp.]